MSNPLAKFVNSLIILGTGQRVGRMESAPEVIALRARDIFHTMVVGKSGFGKSRFLAALALIMLGRNIPFFLIDNTGDLSRLILHSLIKYRWFSSKKDPFSQLMYLDLNAARLKDLYLPFNVLQTGHDPHITAGMVPEAFKRVYPAIKGGTLINIELLIKLSSYILAANNLPLFPYMYYLLSDNTYRIRLISSPSVTDRLVIDFFQQHTNPKTGELTICADPTIKRLFNLCFSPALRYSLGQSRNVLDSPTFLQNGTSVILNVQSPDPEVTRLYGSLVTASIELAAKARLDIPAEKRSGTHCLIIDEFQQYTALSGDSFTTMLEECRKVGLYVCLATQSYSRIPDSIKAALSNTEVRIVFRSEENDAEAVAPLLHFPFDPYLEKSSFGRTPRYFSEAEQRRMHIRKIIRLAKREAFVKLPNDKLYRMDTLTINDPRIDPEIRMQIENEYLRRYFVSQIDVEKEIANNLQSGGIQSPSVAPSATIEPYDSFTDDDTTGDNGESEDEPLNYEDF